MPQQSQALMGSSLYCSRIKVGKRHTQIGTDSHDVRLGQPDERSQHGEIRGEKPFVGQQHHPPVRVQEHQPAIGVDRMVTGVRAERDRTGLDRDRPSHRHIQHDRVTVGDHRGRIDRSL